MLQVGGDLALFRAVLFNGVNQALLAVAQDLVHVAQARGVLIVRVAVWRPHKAVYHRPAV